MSPEAPGRAPKTTVDHDSLQLRYAVGPTEKVADLWNAPHLLSPKVDDYRPADIRSLMQRRKVNTIKAGEWLLIGGTPYHA